MEERLYIFLLMLSLSLNVQAGTLDYETSSYCKKFDCEGKKLLKLKKGKYEFIDIKFFDNEKLEGKTVLEIKKDGFFEGERLLCSPAHHHPWVTVKVKDADHGKGLFANQAYDKYVTSLKEHGKTNVEAVCLEEPISYRNGEFKIFLSDPAHAGEGIFHSKRGDKSLYFKLDSKNHEEVVEWKEEDKSHIKACKEFLKVNKDKVLAIFKELDEVLEAFDKDGTILKEKLIKAVETKPSNGNPELLYESSMCAMIEQINYQDLDYQKCDELFDNQNNSGDKFYRTFIDSALRKVILRSGTVLESFEKESSCSKRSRKGYVKYKWENVEYVFEEGRGSGKIEHFFNYPVML